MCVWGGGGCKHSKYLEIYESEFNIVQLRRNAFTKAHNYIDTCNNEQCFCFPHNVDVDNFDDSYIKYNYG